MSASTYSIISITTRQQAELQTLALPEIPLGPKQVMGWTQFSLISPGTELAVYQGEHFPAVGMGYAAVFQVEAVGSQVQRCKPGDMVFCMGNHSSYQRLLEDDVLMLPNGLSPERAPFARLMGVSMSTLTTTTARPPARVVVSGLGLVGYLAAQIFAYCGYQVIACDPIPARRDLAHRAGIATVATMPTDNAAWAGQTALVIDCSGHEQAVIDGCSLVKKRGEVVLTGVPWRKRTDASAHTLLSLIFHRYAVVRSGWEWELPIYPTDFRPQSIFENIEAALHWLADDRIVLDDIYTVCSPEECQQAYQSLAHTTTTGLTVVFDWTRFMHR